MKQIQMYVCTLCKFYSRRVLDALLYNLGTEILNGNYTGIYTIATIHEKL